MENDNNILGKIRTLSDEAAESGNILAAQLLRIVSGALQDPEGAKEFHHLAFEFAKRRHAALTAQAATQP